MFAACTLCVDYAGINKNLRQFFNCINTQILFLCLARTHSHTHTVLHEDEGMGVISPDTVSLKGSLARKTCWPYKIDTGISYM